MAQTRLCSLVEAVTNVTAGYAIAVVVQLIVFPVLAIDATVNDALAIAAIFTLISILRSYLIRRLFVRAARRDG